MTRTFVRRAVKCIGTGLLVLNAVRRTTLAFLQSEFGGVEEMLPNFQVPDQREPQEVRHG